MGENDETRLREHPRDRLAPAERLLDLDEEFEALIEEPHDPVDGHRQITVAHRKGLTVVLFHFEAGGTMPDHEVDAEITIHVLDGALEISTAEHDHRVSGGDMLILEPDVTHDVEALEESRMMLTICVGEREG